MSAKILCVLQNQWFKNPEKAKRIIDQMEARKGPSGRRDMIAGFLFAGCLTGRRIRDAFAPFIESIEFEESSRDVGGHAASKFPPDPAHIATVIQEIRPAIVIALGKIAAEGTFAAMIELERRQANTSFYYFQGPHPAARGPKTLPALRELATKVEATMKKWATPQ